jgi:RNA polymerase sigma-70 factor (ECF subfamily)
VDDDPVVLFAKEAARAWPKVRTPPALFADHVRGRLPSDVEDSLLGLHGGDLFVAFACLSRDEGAWKELDRSFLAKVPEYVRAVDPSPAFADEVRQRLAEKLSGGDSAPPKLASYSGRGPLAAWLRIVAIREAQSMVRARRASTGTDSLPLPSEGLDPELVLLKRDGTAAFRKAFDDVVASLPDQERGVLKLHYLDGLTLDEVARAFRTSRATAARLILQARERIAQRFQRRLRDLHGANAPNAESLLALVESQLGASVARCFGEAEGD